MGVPAENRGKKWRFLMDYKSKRQYTRQTWDEWYLLAKEYYRINLNLKIPVKYKTEGGFLLGRWIERQRAAYHQKGVYRIDARKIYMLNQIGMVWSLGIRTEWEIWYNYIREYYLENGNIEIPRNYMYRHLPLGEWLSYQRRRYRLGKMSQKQQLKLDALGMKWQLRVRREWDDWYQEAKAYYEEYGHLDIPLDYITRDGNRLGMWINIQREIRRGTRPTYLNEQQISQLNQIGMLWGLRSMRQTEQQLNLLASG